MNESQKANIWLLACSVVGGIVALSVWQLVKGLA